MSHGREEPTGDYGNLVTHRNWLNPVVMTCSAIELPATTQRCWICILLSQSEHSACQVLYLPGMTAAKRPLGRTIRLGVVLHCSCS